MNILGLDPGGTTGWCYWSEHDDKFYFEQLDTSLEDGSDLWIFFKRLSHLYEGTRRTAARETVYVNTNYKVPSGELVILLERFDFRHEERDRDKIDYKAREVIGVVKNFVWMINEEHPPRAGRPPIKLIMQSAHQAKGFFDQDKLRRLGLWKGTQNRHTMDALKHILYYRTFTLGDQSILMRLK